MSPAVVPDDQRGPVEASGLAGRHTVIAFFPRVRCLIAHVAVATTPLRLMRRPHPAEHQYRSRTNGQPKQQQQQHQNKTMQSNHSVIQPEGMPPTDRLTATDPCGWIDPRSALQTPTDGRRDQG